MNKLKEIEGRYFKECNIVMLPTENENVGIYQNPVPEIGVLHYWNKRISNSYIAQHLYITSDDEIKEGDYYINSIATKPTLHKCNSKNDETACNTIGIKSCKKIIATTDKSLTLFNHIHDATLYLPQPSQAFIEKYCELGGIDKVLVEYTKRIFIPDGTLYDLKTDSHNTITIKEVKEKMYSRKEVKTLIKNSIHNFTGMNCYDDQNVIDWIEENL